MEKCSKTKQELLQSFFSLKKPKYVLMIQSEKKQEQF